MKKSIIYLFIAWTFAGMLISCNDDDPIPVPPIVSIFNESGRQSILQGEEIVMKAKLQSSIGTTLQWSIDGKVNSTDSVYTFVAKDVGLHNIILTAKNIDGEDSDTLAVEVLDKLFSIDNRIKHWTGEGENRSVLGIQWVTGDNTAEPADEDVHFLAWGYRWKNNESSTGSDMLKAVAKNDPRLYVILAEQWGISVKGFGYDGNNDGKIEIKNSSIHLTQDDFVDGIYFQTQGQDIDDFKTTDAADYWMGGWDQAYASYWLGGPLEVVPDSDDIEYAPIMVSGRYLENASWDIWTFSSINSDKVNVAPIPRLIQAAEPNK